MSVTKSKKDTMQSYPANRVRRVLVLKGLHDVLKGLHAMLRRRCIEVRGDREQ